MLIKLYPAITAVATPALRLFLQRRLRRGKEDAARLPERTGNPSQERPSGPLIWLHGASVGEAQSALPLIARLQSLRLGVGEGEAGSPPNILITTGTVTSAKLMAQKLPAPAIHQMIPLDALPWVRRFLDHWSPDLVLWLESELWPNWLGELERRGIPTLLVNARMKPKSFRFWQKHPKTIAHIGRGFAATLAQSEPDAARYRAMNFPNVSCPGNLKFAAPPLPADPEKLAALQAVIGERPVIAFVSTHAGEELLAARVHQYLKNELPELLTIIAPRHPNRGNEIVAELASGQPDLNVAQRSAGAMPTATTDLYLADTMGEVGLWYRLAAVGVMGGSFIPFGGHNPLEGLLLGCPMLCGQHMFAFEEMTANMVAAGAGIVNPDERSLRAELLNLLQSPKRHGEMADAALAFAVSEAGVLDRLMAIFDPYLQRLGKPPHASDSSPPL